MIAAQILRLLPLFRCRSTCLVLWLSPYFPEAIVNVLWRSFSSTIEHEYVLLLSFGAILLILSFCLWTCPNRQTQACVAQPFSTIRPITVSWFPLLTLFRWQTSFVVLRECLMRGRAKSHRSRLWKSHNWSEGLLFRATFIDRSTSWALGAGRNPSAAQPLASSRLMH